MTLDATPGGAYADTYIDLTDATAYFTNRRVNSTAWDDSLEQEELLRQACFILDQYDYVGVKAVDGLPGVTQVETATIVGSIVDAGNATVIVTAAEMDNSPVTLSVAVLALDTASAVAGKIRTALEADADVNGFFIVGGTGADVVLTCRYYLADDTTMNLAYDNDDCTGLTGDSSSTNTLAGVAGGQPLQWPRMLNDDGDLIRDVYPIDEIPAVIKYAQCETALWLAQTGGSTVTAAGIKSMKIGNSATIEYETGTTTTVVDTSVDPTGLPIQAARFLKGLRIVNVLA